jgi:hypothetical protein
MKRCLRHLARAALLGAPMLTACAAVEPPTFRVVEAAITERSEEGIVVTFTLEGENPNPEPLPLQEVTYRVDLDGRTVFRGTRDASATLPRYGVQRIELPAAARLDDPGVQAIDQGARFLIDGRLTYLAPGLFSEVLFDAGLIRPTINLRESGVFSVEALLEDERRRTHSAEEQMEPEDPDDEEPDG